MEFCLISQLWIAVLTIRFPFAYASNKYTWWEASVNSIQLTQKEWMALGTRTMHIPLLVTSEHLYLGQQNGIYVHRNKFTLNSSQRSEAWSACILLLGGGWGKIRQRRKKLFYAKQGDMKKNSSHFLILVVQEINEIFVVCICKSVWILLSIQD